jgi:hypothetical protein
VMRTVARIASEGSSSSGGGGGGRSPVQHHLHVRVVSGDA